MVLSRTRLAETDEKLVAKHPRIGTDLPVRLLIVERQQPCAAGLLGDLQVRDSRLPAAIAAGRDLLKSAGVAGGWREPATGYGRNLCKL